MRSTGRDHCELRPASGADRAGQVPWTYPELTWPGTGDDPTPAEEASSAANRLFFIGN